MPGGAPAAAEAPGFKKWGSRPAEVTETAMTSSDIAANRSCIEVHLADPPLIASAATSMIATTMCTKYLRVCDGHRRSD
jgi:hypothetical protein